MSSDQRSYEHVLEQVAKDLKAVGINHLFGIAGDPITPLIQFSERLGVEYFGFRNEQAASYAASAVSVLTRKRETGACITVAGPGMVNALTGLANAMVNGWPMLLLCPFTSSLTDFQGIDQPEAIRGLTKASLFYSSVTSLEVALRVANTAPYGPVVVFISKNPYDLNVSTRIPHPISTFGPSLARTNSFLKASKRILLIIGNGCTVLPEHDSSLQIIAGRTLFLAEMMGRGIVPESHPMCVTAARSKALSTCTGAILVGAKLDWMLAFGMTPKWSPSSKFLVFADTNELIPKGLEDRVLIAPVSQLNQLKVPPADAMWCDDVRCVARINKESLRQKLSRIGPTNQLPTHLQAIGCIKEAIHTSSLEHCMIVSEGANTMDVARLALDRVMSPVKRLDAGRWGTMGSGLGFVLAACALRPRDPVICIQGDSAFGFSGMELETLVRYKCKAIVIIFNNGGIYTGSRDNSTAFTPGVKHHVLMEGFGGTGMSSENGGYPRVSETVKRAFQLMDSGKYPILVDIKIHADSGTFSGSLSRL